MDPTVAIVSGVLIIILITVILASDMSNRATKGSSEEKMRVNRWDIAWGVAYGLVLAVPLLTIAIIIIMVMLRGTLLSSMGY